MTSAPPSEPPLPAPRAIGDRLFRVVMVVYLLAAALITGALIVQEYREAKAGLARELAIYERVFSAPLASVLWEMDRQEMGRIVVGMTQMREILGVRIVDGVDPTIVLAEAGRIGGGVQGAPPETGWMGSGLFWHEFTLRSDRGAETLGRVRIFSGGPVVVERIRGRVLLIVLAALLKTTILWLIFRHYSRVLLSRPLARLTRAAGDLNPDRPDPAPIELGLKDRNELTLLGESFTRMAGRIDQYAEDKRRLVAEIQGQNWELERLKVGLEGTVKDRTADLQAAQEEAEAASRAKSEFLSHMSHDLRTPMNAILGLGEALADSPLTEKQQEYVRVFRTAGDGLMALINDILDVSKIEAGQVVLEEAPIDLRDLAQGVVDLFEREAEAKGIVLKQEIDPRIPAQVTGDPGRLNQVLFNLVGNAVKFTLEGRVTLVVAPGGGDRIRFIVSDTGIGIPVDQLETIFEPFSQGEYATSSRFGGNGLGLTICRGLVTQMGGVIGVDSMLNRGSAFALNLPLPAAPLMRKEGASEATPRTPPEEAPEEPGKSLEILLVDDAEDNRFVIEVYLGEEPCRLSYARDGLQGLEAFQARRFDLVLMDLQMPVMDGFEATRKMRAWEAEQGLAPIPILAVTASAMKEDADKAFAAGCDFHLTKPVRKARLLAVINRFTWRGESAPGGTAS